MVMEEEESTVIDDQKEVVTGVGSGGGGNGVVSPWKKPVAEGADAPVPVLGAESWPGLGDAQVREKSPAAAVAAAIVAELPPRSAAENQTQASGNLQKVQANGNMNSSHRYGQSRSHNGGSNRNSTTGPPFPAHARTPINVHPTYFRPMVPPVSPHPFPPPFPVPGLDISMHAFIPHGHDIDPSRNTTPLARGNPHFNGSGFPSIRPVFPEPGFYPVLHSQQGFRPRDSIFMQQNTLMRPGPYMRPPLHWRPPASISGPGFPGLAGVDSRSAAPPASTSGPFQPQVLPHSMSTSSTDLRGAIVKQIEYYLSDENLKTDDFTLSLMDDQGWISITKIADYKRLKRLSTDIPFILDSLQSSQNVEIQGDKVRKWGNWSDYVRNSKNHASSSQNEAKDNGPLDEKIGSLAI